MRPSPSRIGCWWTHQPFYLFIFTSLHQLLPWPLSLSFHPLTTHFEINFFFFPARVQLMLFSFSWEQSLLWHAPNLSGDASAYNRYQMPIVARLVVWFCCHLPTSTLGFLSDWKLFRTFACRHNNCEFVCHCLPGLENSFLEVNNYPGLLQFLHALLRIDLWALREGMWCECSI